LGVAPKLSRAGFIEIHGVLTKNKGGEFLAYDICFAVFFALVMGPSKITLKCQVSARHR
jgi:hypothetical protein